MVACMAKALVSAARAAAARSQTHGIIGLPHNGARLLPGNRVGPHRAGITRTLPYSARFPSIPSAYRAGPAKANPADPDP